VKARKSGSGRKARRAEEIQSSQEWRKTEALESRRYLKPARVEGVRSFKGQKVLKLRAQAKKFTFKYENGAAAQTGVTGRYYPAEDATATKGPAPVRNAPRLRGSITPGTVVILLAGRFQGKRVVFLKQLDSGLLLVTGPYKYNGVPLRRVNQAYVIATSTSVGDLNGVDLSALNDKLFTKPSDKKDKKSKEAFLKPEEDKKSEVSEEFKKQQKAVDGAVTALVTKTPQLKAYLKSTFTLTNGQYPHLLKF